ncbi:hypothetical protein G6F37_005764 [Rhizopus arrhizus]|nr:hypothetical protein G6F38_002521 [Rhizopus arrhizus]KAG1158469.1 hypothetical protein G6F37_005764 [Rhizopus arrhizus]
MITLRYHTLQTQELLEIETIMLRVSSVLFVYTLDYSLLNKLKNEVYGYICGLIQRMHVCQILNITIFEFLDFLMDVEKGYNNNQYHSFYHAVDAVMVLCYFLECCELFRYLTSMETAILFIATICHDIGHPGKNNQFEVSCQLNLAREFSNLSVLEKLKQSTVKMILATDMVCHFALLENISILRSIIHQDVRQHALPPLHAHKVPDSTQLTGPPQLLPEERLMLCHILTHATDISNPCRPWPIFYRAAQLVCIEFFRQAVEEFHMRLTPHIGNTNPSTFIG